MREKGNSISAKLPNGENGGAYEFRIKGHLDDRWLDWFDGMTLRYARDEQTGLDVTEIRAEIPDQPALHGFLNKIRDLNLTLLSIKRLQPEGAADSNGGEHAAEDEGGG